MTAKGASKLSSEIRVGLIGYGYWGPNYARVLNDLPDVSLAFVCDAREEQLRRAAARFPQVALCARRLGGLRARRCRCRHHLHSRLHALRTRAPGARIRAVT